MGWERIVHKREDLFDKVWAEPVTHVAKHLGISGVALAKICRRMELPLPGRGYWARKAVGSAPSKPTLRPARPDTPLTYVQNRHVGDPAELEAGASIRTEVERQVQAEPPLTVPDTLSDPHPFVARAAVVLQGGARRLDGILLRRRCLDVSAHGDALDRGLRILDTVLKALEGRGHRIEVTAPQVDTKASPPTRTPSRTLVHVGESVVQIAIDEAIQKIPLPFPEPRKPRRPDEYIPRPKREYENRRTGRLHLRITNVRLRGAPEMWSDRKGKKVEDQLNEFVASVTVAAERQRLDKIEAERQRQAAIAQARRHRAIKIQNEADEVLENDLKGRLADWRNAREVESFAAAMRQRATAAGVLVEPESTLARWLDWADCTVTFLDKKAMGEIGKLRKPEGAYELRSEFGWDHQLTMDEALATFFRPIEDLVSEEIAAAAVGDDD